MPHSLKKETRILTELISEEHLNYAAFSRIVQESGLMRDIIRDATRYACVNEPILITGESGTGKELFAHSIHEASPRRLGPYVAVNCGAIPRDLLESELFGHVKGAFTGADRTKKGRFEEANGGTLFLDEVGELSLDHQVKLLRVLQNQELTKLGDEVNKSIKLDVRIITATNRDLLQCIKEKSFRGDLFYRLAVGLIKLPPLRTRDRKDKEKLATILLEETNKKYSEAYRKERFGEWKNRKLSKDAYEFIYEAYWNGNIRELRNAITRAVLISTSQNISKRDMESALIKMDQSGLDSDFKHEILRQYYDISPNINKAIDELSRYYIKRAMDEYRQNKTICAKKLGLKNYQTLSNWMERLGL
jgi:transcriptional regulator with PAS, ATPase and Fis domain